MTSLSIWHYHCLRPRVWLVRMSSLICLNSLYFWDRLQCNSRGSRFCVVISFWEVVEAILLIELLWLCPDLRSEHAFVLRIRHSCAFRMLGRELILSRGYEFSLLTLIQGEKVCLGVKSAIRNRLIAFVSCVEWPCFLVNLRLWFVVRHSNRVVPALGNISLVPCGVLLQIFKLWVVQFIQFEFVMRSGQHVLRFTHTPTTSHLGSYVHTSVILPPLYVMHLNIFKLSWPFLYPSWPPLVIWNWLVTQRSPCSPIVIRIVGLLSADICRRLKVVIKPFMLIIVGIASRKYGTIRLFSLESFRSKTLWLGHMEVLNFQVLNPIS